MSRYLIPAKPCAFPSPLSPVGNDRSGYAISSRVAVVSHGGEGWGEGAHRRGGGSLRGSQSSDVFSGKCIDWSRNAERRRAPSPRPSPPKRRRGWQIEMERRERRLFEGEGAWKCSAFPLVKVGDWGIRSAILPPLSLVPRLRPSQGEGVVQRFLPAPRSLWED